MNSILITGASSAIGKNLIKQIDRKNQTILAHYNKSNEFINFLKKNKFKSKMIPLKCDFFIKKDINKFIKKIKNYKLDTILHLASKRIEVKRFNKLKIEDFNNEINLSFHSIFEILKISLPNMLKEKKGKVVFVLSSGTYGLPSAYLSHYICMKYMLLGLMKSLSAEYKGRGINFNAISPSMMDTPFIKNLDQKFVDLNKYLSPTKSFIKIDTVISKIKFLLSAKSDNIHGANIILTENRKKII